MPDDLLRHFFGGFVRMHILYHAAKEPVWGVEIIEELAPGATVGLSSSVNGSKDEPRRNAVARRSHVTGNPLHDRRCLFSVHAFSWLVTPGIRGQDVAACSADGIRQEAPALPWIRFLLCLVRSFRMNHISLLEHQENHPFIESA